MKTKRERNQERIDGLLTSLRGTEEKKSPGPIDLWAGKKPNSKIKYLSMTNDQARRLKRLIKGKE